MWSPCCLCVCVSVCVSPLSLLCNGSINTFRRQRTHAQQQKNSWTRRFLCDPRCIIWKYEISSSQNFLFMLCFHLRLGSSFVSRFPPEILYARLIITVHAARPSNYATPHCALFSSIPLNFLPYIHVSGNSAIPSFCVLPFIRKLKLHTHAVNVGYMFLPGSQDTWASKALQWSDNAALCGKYKLMMYTIHARLIRLRWVLRNLMLYNLSDTS
jgi:hypothetical protein